MHRATGRSPQVWLHKALHREARELLEASRDQEKPLIFSPDPNQLTNQRMPEIRRRKNW